LTIVGTLAKSTEIRPTHVLHVSVQDAVHCKTDVSAIKRGNGWK
jgi:hypothetical protein